LVKQDSFSGKIHMANPAARTAYGPMSALAVEQYYPAEHRLVQDDLVLQFLPTGVKFLAMLMRWPAARALLLNLSEKRGRGVWGGVLCRKRYIEDRLLEAVSEGIQALVILGAGMDTIAYRLPELKSVPVFEVDLPENIAYKKSVLVKVLGGVPAHVCLIPLDFDRQELGSGLASQGYQIETKSFVIWEAVTQYLSEDGIQKTMSYLSRAEAGSRLVFTYVRKDFIDGTALYGIDYLYNAYRVKSQLWRFGLEPDQVGPFLERFGWKELEQAGSQEYSSRYLQPAGRTMPVMEIERAVYAEKL
jgi:methyltransferase (TIGR00027 family)